MFVLTLLSLPKPPEVPKLPEGIVWSFYEALDYYVFYYIVILIPLVLCAALTIALGIKVMKRIWHQGTKEIPENGKYICNYCAFCQNRGPYAEENPWLGCTQWNGVIYSLPAPHVCIVMNKLKVDDKGIRDFFEAMLVEGGIGAIRKWSSCPRTDLGPSSDKSYWDDEFWDDEERIIRIFGSSVRVVCRPRQRGVTLSDSDFFGGDGDIAYIFKLNPITCKMEEVK